jgi:hypothetical protein
MTKKRKRSHFREFIEELPQLDEFEGDPDVKAVDDALAYWLKKRHPKGFEFNYNNRNLMISLLKKAPKIKKMIMESSFNDYLDVLLGLVWRRTWQRWQERVKKAEKLNQKINHRAILMELLREVIAMGYCLKSLKEDKKEKPLK